MSDGVYVRAWVLPFEIDAGQWAALRQDAIGVLRAASARLEAGRPDDAAGVLRGPDGVGLPHVTPDRIAFNGSSFRGESGDRFVLERCASSGMMVHAGGTRVGRAVRRCDTRGHPYDLAVCALLLTTRRHLGELMRLGTTGSLRDGWRDAADVVREALGDVGQLVQSETGLIGWTTNPPSVTRERSAQVRTRSA
jgi:hypothetical protein